MSKQFKGFEGKNTEEPEASDSNSESTYLSDLAEYDSTPESRETSPSRSYPVASTDTVVRKDQTGKVKKLVEHYSQSDSDSSDRTVRSTRRSRSKNLDHQELPQGGLREVRRKMAAQETADSAIRVNEALLDELKENLNEAQKALDEDKPRAILLGELEGVQQAQETAWESIEKIMTFQNNPDIVLNFEQFEIKVNKIKIRTRKVLGYLKAATEVNEPAGSTIKVVTPMNFGDLQLPEFDGDYTEFEPFEGNWKKLIVNGKLDDGSKKAYLLKCLKGEARDYIGSEGIAAKNYEDIWSELRQRYGKPWRVTRAAVKKLLNIPDPRDDSKDILRYWNEITEACKTAERLGMTASSVILNMALLKLPADYRSKMDDKLKPHSKDYVLTRNMVTEPFNDVIAIELERPKNIISTLGFNTSAAPTQPIRTQSFPPRTGYRGGKLKHYCLLCNMTTDHKTPWCTVYPQGQQARTRLQQLGRCGNCAVVRDEHGEKCSHRAVCNAHPNQRHHYWLCDSQANRGSGSHLPTIPSQQQQRKWKINNNNPQA